MKTVNCEGVDYLAHEAIGGAALWIRPTALHYCHGRGLDIGYSKPEWQLPGSIGVEPEIDKKYDAMHLPNNGLNNRQWDYIHSSHCLEHVKENWHNVLDYWLSALKVGGILFLYLPHASQNYWQPRNNRKHIHSFQGQEIDAYLKGLGHQVFVSGVDANHSFTVICEKVAPEPEFGSIEYFSKRSKLFADETEDRLIKEGTAYIREGNNVIFNDPLPLINPSRWFEQNTEDLANKIADMRMESEKIFIQNSIHITYEEAERKCWDKFNIERMKFNLSQLSFDIYKSIK